MLPRHDNMASIEFLLSKGASKEGFPYFNNKRKTPFVCAIEFCHTEAAKKLIPDDEYTMTTCLDRMIKLRMHDLVRILIQHSPASVNCIYPQTLCAALDAPILVSVLLDSGVSPDEVCSHTKMGDIPLAHAAAFDGHADSLVILLKKGADPDIETEDGKTAVDLARSNKKLVCEGILQNAWRFVLERHGISCNNQA